MMVFQKRFKKLEAELAEQRQAIERLRGGIAAQQAPSERMPAPDGEGEDAPRRSTRRALITGGAVAAGAALAGTIAAPKSASAADGGNMIIGGDNVSAEGSTRLSTPAGSLLINRNILTVSSGVTSSGFPAAIGGTANGGRVTNGVYGYADHRDTGNNTGHAVVARRENSARSNILMPPSGASPTLEAVPHGAGELRVDDNGNLWYCVLDGTPGTWRRLAGVGTAGSLHWLPASRVFDSRREVFGSTPLVAGTSRIVSVADRVDVVTGVVNLANLVPVGATGVLFNLTIVGTVGAGFLAVVPGTQTTVTGATINWTTTGQTVANASGSAIDVDRRLNILSGGSGSTHFVVDVTGYTR